jgi:hypothetical protein
MFPNGVQSKLESRECGQLQQCAGIKAGVAAGIAVVALATTQEPERLTDAGASIVINDYHDVLEIIAGSNATNGSV